MIAALWPASYLAVIDATVVLYSVYTPIIPYSEMVLDKFAYKLYLCNVYTTIGKTNTSASVIVLSSISWMLTINAY